MIYPTIKQYREAIAESHDNLSQLSYLSPVKDNSGKPYMITGGFGVVFKMKDKDGKLFALKCFTKEQRGREEAYKKIDAELHYISSEFLARFNYYENELFVDMEDDGTADMPVVCMEWIEGTTLDKSVESLIKKSGDLSPLVYRFSLLTRWLLNQTFAHGDIKPDNIIVRADGTLVLVDYDSMFVPSMRGEQARDAGTPGYTHPNRSNMAFDEHIDDFSLIMLELSLKALSLNPSLYVGNDQLILSKQDFIEPHKSSRLLEVMKLAYDEEIQQLLGQFFICLKQGTLDGVDDKLTNLLMPTITQKPKRKGYMPVNSLTCVDLGLSVKWATMNVGATAPHEYGDYFAWGETESKSIYGWSTYIGDTAVFIGDNKTILDPEDDAAAVNWGGDWVMPSLDDFKELEKYCTYEWTTQNGVCGYKITGTNGNSIILPTAGYRYSGSLRGEGSSCYYWSSSLYEYGSYNGRYLNFYSGFFNLRGGGYRSRGQSVRPVCPSAGNTNGHVAVDLGLPSGKLWAECNVGASTPEASGDYIAWGETEAKEYYDWNSYKHMQSGKSEWYYINKYQVKDGQFDAVWYKNVKYQNNGGKRVLDAADDAATANWGGKWRMPTAAEWKELYDNTIQTWTNDYEGTGVRGYILTSKKAGYEGVSIFLPAADFLSTGNYLSRSLNEDDSSGGRDLYFYEGHFGPWSSSNRCNGFSVRPVCPSAE